MEEDHKPDSDIKAVAKTTDNVINAAREFSQFLKEIFGDSFKNVGEVARIKTEQWKLDNGIKLRDKYQKLVEEGKISSEQYTDLRIGVPLLEAAVNEDNDKLQDMWASLLASSTENKSPHFTRKSFVETAKQIDPIDAENIEILFPMLHSSIFSEKRSWVKFGTPTEKINWWNSLKNLERLGILQLNKPPLNHDEIDTYNEGSIDFRFCSDEDEEKNAIQVVIEFTSYGFLFCRAATGIKFIVENESTTGELTITDFDEFATDIGIDREKIKEWVQKKDN